MGIIAATCDVEDKYRICILKYFYCKYSLK